MTLSIEVVAIIANTLFLVSYVELVSHIFRVKSVEGLSGRALLMWLAAVVILFWVAGYLVRWYAKLPSL